MGNTKNVLVVVDMQKDFIDGALGTKEAVQIVDNVAELVKGFDGEVVFTRDTHFDNYLDTQEGKKLPVPHCIKGTDGWQLDKKLEALRPGGMKVFDKPTFGWTHWNEMRFEEIELVGLCTDICVVSNALLLKAMFPDVEITVDADCCAGVTPQTHRAALKTMKMCQIQVVGEAA